MLISCWSFKTEIDFISFRYASRPRYCIGIARHYDIQAWTLSDARKFLDVKYHLGWRVVKMTPMADKAELVADSRVKMLT